MQAYYIGMILRKVLYSKTSLFLLLFSTVLTVINSSLLFLSHVNVPNFRVSVIEFQIIIQLIVSYIIVSKRFLCFINIGFDGFIRSLCKGIKFAIFMELAFAIIMQVVIWTVSVMVTLLVIKCINNGDIFDTIRIVFSGFEFDFVVMIITNIILIQMIYFTFAAVFKTFWGLVMAFSLLFIMLVVDSQFMTFYGVSYFSELISNHIEIVINQLAYIAASVGLLFLCLQFYYRQTNRLIVPHFSLIKPFLSMNFTNPFTGVIILQIRSVFFNKGSLAMLILLTITSVFELSEFVDGFGNPFILSPMLINNQFSDIEILPVIYMFVMLFVIGEFFKHFQSHKFREIILIAPITNQRIVFCIACSLTLFWLMSVVLLSIANFVTMSVIHYLEFRYMFICLWSFVKYFFHFLFIGYGVIFIYALFNNRIISAIVSIFMAYIFSILEFYILRGCNYDLLLLDFAYLPRSEFSDINSSIELIYFLRSFLFVMYWLSVCYCLLLFASYFFERSITGSFSKRVKNARFEVRRLGYKIILPTILVVVFGSLIHYYLSINQENERDENESNYNALYGKFFYLEQPEITDADFDIQFHANKRVVSVRSRYKLNNISSKIIDTVLLSFPLNIFIEPESVLLDISSNYEVVLNDSVNNMLMITLNNGLAPGDSLLVNYDFVLKHTGFEMEDRNINFSKNGSFIESDDIAIKIGYDSFKCGERGQLYFPKNKMDRCFLLARNFAGNCRMSQNVRLNVCCPDNEQVITSGNLQNVFLGQGNKYYQFKIEKGLIYFGVFAGNYEKISCQMGNLTINMFFTNEHRQGAEHLLKTAKQVISYCINKFGSIDYDEINIVETTVYRSGGTCFQNTIALQENYFISDFSNIDKLKLADVLLSHEIAHIWWGLKLKPANIRGARVLTDGLSEYTAISLITELQSEKLRDVYIERIKQQYQLGFQKDDNPKSLAESSSEEYLIYKKGGLVFYAVGNLIGHGRLNDILADFIEDSRGEYATVADLVDYILERVPDDEKREIYELFYERGGME